MSYCLLSFQDSHQAIAAEGLLLAQGLGACIVPLPSAIAAGCGLCLRLPEGSAEAALAHLRKAELSCSGLFSVTEVNHQKEYREVKACSPPY